MKNSHAYIFVHDQDIIKEYEKTKKISKTFGKEYSYVFVGYNELNLDNSNIIVCRDLPINIEQHKNLVTYTGWYALVKNNLLTHEYNFMLEYDVVLSPKFDQIVSTTVKQARTKNVFSFIPNDKDYFFYEYLPDMFYNKNLLRIEREEFIALGFPEKWMGTSNSLWNKNFLKEFVEWFEQWLECDQLMKYDGIGHVVERAITVFCIIHRYRYNFVSGVLEHFFLDSHQTQSQHNNGIQRDYKQHISELARR